MRTAFPLDTLPLSLDFATSIEERAKTVVLIEEASLTTSQTPYTHASETPTGQHISPIERLFLLP
jgi:hypothetical protein